MSQLSAFPHTVRELEHLWIPLPDGTRLAARIWLPDGAEETPVPAILEYIPYRKNDDTAPRDARMHPYFAGHGYAAVRVDMRGSGESDGILLDEYLPQEQDDALAVLAWLAEQPWCTGRVGIIGKSWGGFNGLQIAARRPPELGAVITVCSTDDRYADDVHYMGGCLLAADMLPWASTMLAYNARPPDPRHFGPEWRSTWFRRMAESPPFVEAWVEHQRRDAFWRHGSVCEDFGAIAAPVLAVGGWADGYTNAVFRLLAGLTCPRRGIVGPWAHLYPMDGIPGPAIGFLQECLRWWDRWLKEEETGVMAEPMLYTWLQEPIAPAHFVESWPGRWAGDHAWPLPDGVIQRFYLNDDELGDSPGPPGAGSIGSVQSHGMDAGAWCSYGRAGELPIDQRAEDGKSLCFTSAPLAESLDLLGFPTLRITVAADRPLALLAARLCAVMADGSSLLLSRGMLNLTHRDGHVDLQPLTPGEPVTVTVTLNACGFTLPAGTHLRLALTPTYWPFAWPSPEPVTLTVQTGAASYLELPVRPPLAEEPAPPDFGPPVIAAPLPVTVLRTGHSGRTHEIDVTTERHTLVVTNDEGRLRFETNDGLEHEARAEDCYEIVEGDPLSARVTCRRTSIYRRDAWSVRIETESVMTGDATHFLLTNQLEAYEGETRVFARNWHKRIARDHQ